LRPNIGGCLFSSRPALGAGDGGSADDRAGKFFRPNGRDLPRFNRDTTVANKYTRSAWPRRSCGRLTKDVDLQRDSSCSCATYQYQGARTCILGSRPHFPPNGRSGAMTARARGSGDSLCESSGRANGVGNGYTRRRDFPWAMEVAGGFKAGAMPSGISRATGQQRLRFAWFTSGYVQPA